MCFSTCKAGATSRSRRLITVSFVICLTIAGTLIYDTTLKATHMRQGHRQNYLNQNGIKTRYGGDVANILMPNLEITGPEHHIDINSTTDTSKEDGVGDPTKSGIKISQEDSVDNPTENVIDMTSENTRDNRNDNSFEISGGELMNRKKIDSKRNHIITVRNMNPTRVNTTKGVEAKHDIPNDFDKSDRHTENSSNNMNINKEGFGERIPNVVDTTRGIARDNKAVLEVKTSPEIARYMGISFEPAWGRLGNRLFQIATVLATAQANNYTAVVPPEVVNIVRDAVDLKSVKIMPLSDIENVRVFYTNNVGMYDPTVTRLSPEFNWILDGCFQSWKYFLNQESYVRDNMKLKEDVLSAAKGFLETLIKGNNGRQDILVIGVHVRRGDFVLLEQKGYTVATEGYIKRAMNVYNKRYPHANKKYVFVSDDLKWCRDSFLGSEFAFSPFDGLPAVDLALLSLSNHTIITSGTFGWMGAWLCNGDVVYNRGFPTPDSVVGRLFNLDDYYPPHWSGVY